MVRITVVPSAASLRTSSQDCRIKPGGGLIENQERGVANDPQPDVEPPLLTAGQGLDLRVGLLSQADQVDYLTHPPRRRVEACASLKHLANRQERLHREFLEHDTELTTQSLAGATVAGIDSQHPHLARVAAAKTLENLDRGRLARAIGTQQREHLPGLNLKAHPVNGPAPARTGP